MVGLEPLPSVEALPDQAVAHSSSGEAEGSAGTLQHFSRPDVATGSLQLGAKTPEGSSFDVGARAPSISDCALLRRFSDGVEVIEVLRAKPWLVEPVLSAASRLVLAEVSTLMPVVSALQAPSSSR